jgi:hypothetical protein
VNECTEKALFYVCRYVVVRDEANSALSSEKGSCHFGMFTKTIRIRNKAGSFSDILKCGLGNLNFRICAKRALKISLAIMIRERNTMGSYTLRCRLVSHL